MKLISKFHDYYDSVLSIGRDDSIVYIRHTEDIKLDKSTLDELEKTLFDPIPERRRYYELKYNTDTGTFDPIFFFFCGKIYLTYRFKLQTSEFEENVDMMLHSFEAVEAAIEKYKNAQWTKEESNKGLRHGYNKSIYYRQRFFKKHVKEAFDKYNGNTETDFNIKYKTPVIVLTSTRNNLKAIANPILREYDFVRLFDPYTAFQEISMYIGGVMGNNEPPMLEVDEKTKISQHGYDKWSFRQMPGDKKRKKK